MRGKRSELLNLIYIASFMALNNEGLENVF